MKRKKLLLLSLLIPAFGLQVSMNACTKDVAEPPLTEMMEDTTTCDTLLNGFSQDVKPIFASNCATSGCHNSSSGQGNIVLETYSQIKNETENGKVLCAIRHENGCQNMPGTAPKLAESKIRAIECWARTGYPND